ncbi:hypothetical protein Pcinc_028041 [Petrolisthes cinctipes]|uniref:RING-type E3 ubiquitin transferase n=1 Tax=Petrolisthes cinctipes TaxID=88211 RepID=A0AAE1F3T5_PETCI|nr:hypothetical protein Pcinc_028041 [Petrolisthes cinctipes]
MTLSDLGVCVSSSSSNKRSNTTSPSIQPVHSQEQNDVRGGVPPPPMERCASNNSSTFSYNQDICRICHCEGDAETPLIAPCYCAGSLRYVHQSCLQQWIKSSDTKSCELCKFNFIMHSKIKPFNKWEGLDMSGMERRKIACSVTFHIVAITCVIWSLYVLIERTTEEVQEGTLEWPFWTKLIVVAIGFTGGLVFMYVQCKMYAQLVKRWRDFNRVIYVQNAPEKVPLSERDRAELQREVVVVMMAGTQQQQQQQQGTGNKETCSEATHVEPDKSLMGVLSGIRRHSTTTTATQQQQQQQRTTTPVVHDEGKCNHGSMEELSSQALVVQSSEKMCQQPFSKSICSHSCMCLEKKSHALAQPFTTTTTGSHSCMCLEEKRRKSVVEERDLSSQNPAQPFSKSTTISSHSCLCLDKNKSVVERGSGSGGCYSVAGDQEPSSYFLDNYGPVSRDIAHSTTTYTNSGSTSSSKRGGDFLDNYGPASRDTAHSTTTTTTNSSSKRGGGDEALRGGGGVVEHSCRMIHTPSLSLQCRTEGVVEAHEVETLHLDENM